MGVPEGLRVFDHRFFSLPHSEFALNDGGGAVGFVRPRGAPEIEDRLPVPVDGDLPVADSQNLPGDFQRGLGLRGKVASQGERGQDPAVKDAKERGPPVDVVTVRVQVNIAEDAGGGGHLRHGEGGTGEGDALAAAVQQPLVEAEHPNLRLRGEGRPFPFAALGPAQGGGRDKAPEIADCGGEGPVVVHAVPGGLREKHVEGQRSGAGALAVADDRTVDFPGPGPGQAVFLPGPVQAVLVEEDDADLVGGFCGPGHGAHPPVPGLGLPGIQPARQEKEQRHGRAGHPGGQAQRQFFCKTGGNLHDDPAPAGGSAGTAQIRPTAFRKRSCRSFGVAAGGKSPPRPRTSSIRSRGAGCVLAKSSPPGLSFPSMTVSMSISPPGL